MVKVRSGFTVSLVGGVGVGVGEGVDIGVIGIGITSIILAASSDGMALRVVVSESELIPFIEREGNFNTAIKPAITRDLSVDTMAI